MHVRRLLGVLALSLGLAASLLVALNSPPQTTHAWPIPSPGASRSPGPAFVKPGGTGDWCLQDDPCGSIQYALEQCEPGNGDTIYVAEGTYTSTGGAVIRVTKSVTLYGGWDGTVTTPVLRDPEAHVTTLDGEGERRVIHLGGTPNPITATIDGFVIANGNAAHAPNNAGRGGGICSIEATPRIAHNVITNNVAGPSDADGKAYGGGIYLLNPDGTAVITANQVTSNVANVNGQGHGGGLYLSGAPSAQVVNNTMMRNTAVLTGGSGRAGGLYLSDAPTAQVMGNVVLSNTAVLSGDDRGRGGGVTVDSSPDVTVTGNVIAGNVAYRGPTWQSSDGGGVYCRYSHDLVFRDNVVRGNVVNLHARGGTGGGMQLWGCYRATVANSDFTENASSGQDSGSGGGLYSYAARDLTLEGNRFVDNRAYRGGGLYLGHNTWFAMRNNLVAENVGGHEGGGMAFEAWPTEPVSGTLVHNTFAANDKGSRDGRIAIHLNEAYVTLTLTNNLIYGHTYGIYAVTTSTAQLDHTLFYAHSSGDVGGPGAIVNSEPITGYDPRLTSDYHLSPGSPAIDAGVDAGVYTDIDGDTRPQNSGYDIGADELYEWHIYLPLVLK